MIENPFKPDGTYNIDNERKAKVFEIAKHLKKNVYQLRIGYQDGEWLVICTALIEGTPYESANTIDAFSAKDHADLFRYAFANVLKELEAEKKSIITLH
jgi:hypothetical protein